MGVETRKSKAITNRDASPQVKNVASLAAGTLREIVGVVTGIATTDDVGSTYVLGQIPSNARVSEILLTCTDSGDTGAIDLGVYRTTQDGGAAVQVDLFASGQVMTTALTKSDITHESGVFTAYEKEQLIWEALGLSADPSIMYDLVATLTAVTTAETSLAINLRYAA